MFILPEKSFINDIIDDMKWSFSRLNSFYSCPRSWFYTYIMKMNEKENFFSQYGTFAHSIFEKYNKEELEIFELGNYFANNYENNVTIEAPPNKYVNLNESYFEKGYNYFNNFEGNDDKTIGSELEFSFDLFAYGKKRKFVGFIDRVSEDENGIIITDYKSKGKFKSKEELNNYARQLYIYSIAVKQKFGKYPYKLVFNQFKENKIVEIDFDIEELKNTVKWINKTFELIYNEVDFKKNENDFFCYWLCSCKDICDRDSEII